MNVVGKVDSLWRYPVKSMAGEEIGEAFVGFAGVYGDRLFAFRSSAAPAGFPYLTGREQEQMLLYRPRFRDAARAAKPVNLAEALTMGITPLYADVADLSVGVETPSGEELAIDDPALIDRIGAGLKDGLVLTLLRSGRAMTDCRPISLISVQTARQLGEEAGIAVDKRRFRANIYLDIAADQGFEEDAYVGRKLRIGSDVVLAALERDPRCKMIALDPDTGAEHADLLRTVTRRHGGRAGIYCAVLSEGMIASGDPIELLD